jgi:putative DNA primase/helicase
VHGWTFSQARAYVLEVADLRVEVVRPPHSGLREVAAVATPSGRVKKLLRESTTPDAVQDAIDYLRYRGLWPLPAGCALRAHAAAEYWSVGDSIGRYPALLGEVRDLAGELVTVHVTYLRHGRKLDLGEPRKLLGKLTGRRGCAIRLLPNEGQELGVAEGVETALAAHRLHQLPVWSALNATLLAKWVPPPDVHHVVIFADRDVAGLEAALELTAQLDGRVSVETRVPPAPAKDWADLLPAGFGS